MKSVEGFRTTPLSTQQTPRDERGSGRKGGWRKQRWKEREKATVFHSPRYVLSVKTSRLCLTALHSTAPQPLRLMAVLADHNTTPSLWQGQTGSKRILAFNQTIRDTAQCWHAFTGRLLFVLLYTKIHLYITKRVCDNGDWSFWKSLKFISDL